VKKIERFIIYPLIVASFAIVAFFDLPISENLFNPSNIYGGFFEVFTEIPCYLMSIFACWLIFRFHPSKNREWDICIRVISFLAALGISFYGGYHTSGLLIRVMYLDFSRIVLALILTIPYFGIGIALSFLAKKENAEEAFLLGVYFLVTMACSLLVMQGLKMVWLRPRYRTLKALEEAGAISEASNYWLPFYHPQLFTAFSKYTVGGSCGFSEEEIAKTLQILGISSWKQEEFYSFPSGHVMNTLAILGCSFLYRIRSKEEGKVKAIYIRIGIYALALCVAFSRIVRGAHNATDVTFGFLLGVLLFDILSHFFYEGVLRKKLLPKLSISRENEVQSF